MDNDKEFNKKIKQYIKSMAYWQRELKAGLAEPKKEFRIKFLKNSSDAIYSNSVRLCDIISDYSK